MSVLPFAYEDSYPPSLYLPPAPLLVGIAPDTAVVGSADLLMVVYGTDFTPSCVIVFNGGLETTDFTNDTELSTWVQPTSASGPAVVPVQVRYPGGRLTAPVDFTFTATGTQAATKPGFFFDPGAVTVAEVLAYVEAHPDQTEVVLDRELAGKNRSTLVTQLEDLLA